MIFAKRLTALICFLLLGVVSVSVAQPPPPPPSYTVHYKEFLVYPHGETYPEAVAQFVEYLECELDLIRDDLGADQPIVDVWIDNGDIEDYHWQEVSGTLYTNTRLVKVKYLDYDGGTPNQAECEAEDTHISDFVLEVPQSYSTPSTYATAALAESAAESGILTVYQETIAEWLDSRHEITGELFNSVSHYDEFDTLVFVGVGVGVQRLKSTLAQYQDY